MNYKKGDTVVIRSDLEADNTYPRVTEWMAEQYRGQHTIIEKIMRDCYVFAIDDGDFLWTDKAIDHEATAMLNVEFDRCPSNKDQGYTEKDILKRIDILEKRLDEFNRRISLLETKDTLY